MFALTDSLALVCEEDYSPEAWAWYHHVTDTQNKRVDAIDSPSPWLFGEPAVCLAALFGGECRKHDDEHVDPMCRACAPPRWRPVRR